MVWKQLELVSMVTRSVCVQIFSALACSEVGVTNRGGNIYVTEMETILGQRFKGVNGLETACNNPDMVMDYENLCGGKSEVDCK